MTAAWLVAVLLMAAVPALGARQASPRVVGGTAGAITAVPYQAALVRNGMSTYDGQYCGAVILGPRHVLTAAHCVYEGSPATPIAASSISVLAGTAHLRKPAETTPGPAERQVAVAAIHPDPDYRVADSDHDVAVIALAEPLYSGSPTIDGIAPIAPIRMQTASQTAASVSAMASVTLSGWGYTADLADASSPKLPANYPQDLQVATQHLVTNAACQAAYVQVISANMVCAGGGSDPAACNGDSGGPLASPAPGGPLLTGLVSFGVPCHHAASPDVYTRVGAPDIVTFIATALAAPIPGDGGGGQTTTTTTSTTTTTTTTGTTTSTTTTDPGVDVAGPAQHVVRMRCERTACVLNVQVTDPPPSAGIRALETRQRWRRRVVCGQTTCLRRPFRYIRATALGGDRYSVRAPRLPGRTSTLLMRGIDAAGKRAYRGTIVTVPKLRGT